MADSTADTVSLGIIGLGQQGGMYAKIITDGMVPHMTVAAICDTAEDKRQLARSTCPEVPVYVKPITGRPPAMYSGVLVGLIKRVARLRANSSSAASHPAR